MKTAKYFSVPLMKQTVRSNRVLTIVIFVVMVLMCIIVTIAQNTISSVTSGTDTTDAQLTFINYLTILADNGYKFDYDTFMTGVWDSEFTTLFENNGYTLAGFKECIEELMSADGSLYTYIQQFEYYYELLNAKGVFTGNNLSYSEISMLILESMGVSSDLLNSMSDMDMSSMFNQMYYTIMGILPLLVYVVVVGNSLIASQVDRGSMAYVLSTPTKRSAVAITQAIYMIVVPFIIIAVSCCVKLASSALVVGSVEVGVTVVLYLGMYILIEAIGALCYLGSCLFNRSGKSMAFGGGLTVWFFLASLLGMFGSDNFVELGMGVEALGVFNNLTLIGLFDVNSIATIGSGAVDLAFVWKFAILIVIAAAAYVLGAVRFTKKDLPL